MNDEIDEFPVLSARERAAWTSAVPPADFAARVVAMLEPGPVIVTAPDARGAWRRPGASHAVAIGAAALAATAVLWLARDGAQHEPTAPSRPTAVMLDVGVPDTGAAVEVAPDEVSPRPVDAVREPEVATPPRPSPAPVRAPARVGSSRRTTPAPDVAMPAPARDSAASVAPVEPEPTPRGIDDAPQPSLPPAAATAASAEPTPTPPQTSSKLGLFVDAPAGTRHAVRCVSDGSDIQAPETGSFHWRFSADGKWLLFDRGVVTRISLGAHIRCTIKTRNARGRTVRAEIRTPRGTVQASNDGGRLELSI